MLVEVVSIGMAADDEIITGFGTALRVFAVDVSMGVADEGCADIGADARGFGAGGAAGAGVDSSPL